MSLKSPSRVEIRAGASAIWRRRRVVGASSLPLVPYGASTRLPDALRLLPVSYLTLMAGQHPFHSTGGIEGLHEINQLTLSCPDKKKWR